MTGALTPPAGTRSRRQRRDACKHPDYSAHQDLIGLPFGGVVSMFQIFVSTSSGTRVALCSPTCPHPRFEFSALWQLSSVSVRFVWVGSTVVPCSKVLKVVEDAHPIGLSRFAAG